ncbi:MAG TPA: hypothetical protein VI612_04830 [Candidatus Nanoarchaeia archaeon]|nr:hypothetical protein [Candidatus Nanoarchaeia archaeon]
MAEDNFEDRVLQKLKKVAEKLEKVEEKIGPKGCMMGCSSLIGAFFGTLDVLASGYPIASLGIPIYGLLSQAGSDEYAPGARAVAEGMARDMGIRGIDRFKNFAAYVLSASIPFAIYYAKDIADLLT